MSALLRSELGCAAVWRRCWLLGALVAGVGLAPAAAAQREDSRQVGAPPSSLESDGYFLQAELSPSLFAEADDANSPGRLFRSLGWAAKLGRRWTDVAVFGSLEANFWRSARLDRSADSTGVINLGLGGELLSAHGLLRTSLAVGPSLLVLPSDVDAAGTLGFFLDLRPLGLRFVVVDGLICGIDPITFNLTMPVLSGIPLIEIEYRSSVHWEVAL